jgi:hypothetical protein
MENTFKEVFYSEFYTIDDFFKAKRPKQAQAQTQGNNTHLRNTPDDFTH